MSWPFRVTPPLLSTVDALTRAGGKLHGWALAEMSGETPPNVYRALERLRTAGWVEHQWESEAPEGRPRRRLYWLNAQGWNRGPALLAERGRERSVRTMPAWARRLAGSPSETA